MGVEEEDGVGGPAGLSEGEGDGEEVEEETEEWLISSTRPCSWKRHTGGGVKRFDSRVCFYIELLPQSNMKIRRTLHSPLPLHPPESPGGAVLCSW